MDGAGGSDANGVDEGYVHRPEGQWDERTDARGRPPADDTGEGLGRAGWVLVGVVVLAFLVIPGVIYLRPATPGELGFGFLAAMLVLPMLPAALLGATAVWSAVRGRDG
ncbi:hypothetical protein HUG12_07050 [Halorarum salinum]|uniref:Uncharacterized protein n=1 Tax=Halorarum salinum TaxID=2743089 RepID=A0A7D5LDI3_9EURY|nr:hypothetical protein HUG12_07050 [Halobaculum salinum]